MTSRQHSVYGENDLVRKTSSPLRRRKLATACNMRVPVLGTVCTHLGLVTNRSLWTRAQWPAVLTDRFPHRSHGSSAWGDFRLSVVRPSLQDDPYSILTENANTKRDVFDHTAKIYVNGILQAR